MISLVCTCRYTPSITPVAHLTVDPNPTTPRGAIKPAGPLDITMTVNGDSFAAGHVPISAPLLFTANDCLDIGTCLGSPVSLDYYDRAPFPFTGEIHNVNIRYTS